ncbi:MAG TPA: DsbC family protein [Burkholderiales bacterium]|jgi:thiol:disulfide interchange protein DsbC|nr:DsbC family protein [Burkholderiales bacterium]HXJ52500.1 DsbC family protein [Burkholderiales bacterium]
MLNRLLLLIAALALSSAALAADDAELRRTLEPKLGVQIDGIEPGPVPGLYEVRYRSPQGVQVIYVDATGNYVIQGKIYDLRAERDLTEERLRKLNAIKFESLPLELAVKIQRGDGKRVLAMFSDPYCPACRQFERSLAQVDNVTIYVFMYPVIRPENTDHSRMVWCSADRAKAWLELAAAPKPKVPNAAKSCGDPVDKVLKLGRSLAVNSTPTLILANGERVSGGLAADDLKDLLDQTSVAKR